MIIRPEQPSDCNAIQNVQIQAFANHPISRQTEHLIVKALREANALSISLVAEENGMIVGHIAFSPVLVNGTDIGWYTLGPIGILPDHQRKGIGSRLIHEGVKALRQLGARGCCLVGDPNYYRRFGFGNTSLLAIEGVPAEYFMCLTLSGHTPEGTVTLNSAFFAGLDPA